MDDYCSFLVDRADIAEIRRIASLIREEYPSEAVSLDGIADDSEQRRVMDDTCY